MYYLCDKDGKCETMCGVREPLEEMADETMQIVESESIYNLSDISLVDGEIIITADFTLTLEDLKERKRAEMKAARDTAESEPLIFKNTKLDFDQISRERLMFAIIAKEPVEWTDYNNEVIKLTDEDLEQLPTIIKARAQSVHTRYNELKSLIEKAKTKEEVDSLTWAD